MKRDEEGYLNAKVFVLGGSGSGKTNIISRYINKRFIENGCPTASPTFIRKKIEINDKFIILDIWDTPGNKPLRKFNLPFIKDADAIILVYDITDKYYFEDLKNYWELYIRDNIPKNASKKKIFFI